MCFAPGSSYTYEPFGTSGVTGASGGNSFDYTGRENDGTGLKYFRARYYHPGLQRFIGEDPIGMRGGDVNLYAYVRNSPLRLVDPLGLYVVEYTYPEAGCLRLTGRKSECGPSAADVSRTMYACAAGCVGDAAIIGWLVLGGVGAIYIQSKSADIAAALDELLNSISLAKGDEPFWESLKPYRDGTRTNGESGKQRRYYERDRRHGDLEVWDREGGHLGSADPVTGELTKPAVPGRTNKNVR